MQPERNRACPVELANSLDSRIRRWLQDPSKILAPYVKERMSVLDIGCGPGFFSIEMAKIVGKSGKVISADLQAGMLQRLGNKITGREFEDRIRLVQCDKDRLNVTDRVDFILAFYMVHEVPDKPSLFGQRDLNHGTAKTAKTSKKGSLASLALRRRVAVPVPQGRPPALFFAQEATGWNAGS